MRSPPEGESGEPDPPRFRADRGVDRGLGEDHAAEAFSLLMPAANAAPCACMLTA